MKQLQLLCLSIIIGVLVGGIWAVVGLIFGPPEYWSAAGGAAAGVYWACNRDRS